MFHIKILESEAEEHAAIVQAVAMIESIVQLQEPWTEQTLNDLLKQDSIDLMVVMSTETDEVVGYCLYQVVFEQAEILRIGTRPNYQRQGIASQIFARLNIVLKDSQVDNLLLEVRADNTPAIALYERQEFVVIHKRKGYYQLAVDALIMQHVYQ
ncbi:ribosomal protein S18-alanine N-acetyltransferase [Psychrobacter sp. NZS113]|uniref:ribosomal protein S18-alanine N-acetyltransferase n=1 Tax=Psychrobacter sp. NZS113 TaxID=2792045 RepID=UPI0018CDE526|nr:ribosomal protein S18-alanine N-acetyltransferase [Psychrobacter sp. NZS113]MBH0097320.1 ribosomal protein S18-alanine N-acetyltransferase [Psychrobacter sp. NZS113]